MLKIKVKAGSITNLTDARYFAAREVEWLGFPLGSGEGFIEPIQVKAIAEWVDGVRIVGEFGFSRPEEILAAKKFIGLDAVQVNMFTSLKDISQLAGITIIKEVVAGADLSEQELENHLDNFSKHCDFFLLNMSAAGYSWKELVAGRPYSAAFLNKLCGKHKIILGLDCSADEIDQVLDEVKPYALSFNGGEEEKTGVKSFDELDELLDVLEVDG